MITRILKFLMIAAVAWPAWTTATAQNAFQQQPVEKEVKELLPSKGGDIKEAKAISPAAKESQINIDFNENQGANVNLSVAKDIKEIKQSSRPAGLTTVSTLPNGKEPKSIKKNGISLKSEAVTITPPSGAVVEEWNISSTYYDSSGASN